MLLIINNFPVTWFTFPTFHQITSKADWSSGLMTYTPSLFWPDLKMSAQFLKARIKIENKNKNIN